MKPLRELELHIQEGLPTLAQMRDELDEMLEVLLGRVEPPIDHGEATLMEVANAFYARGKELEILLLRAETEGLIPKASKLQKFRTGELRSFNELASKANDLGSRRITLAKEAWEAAGH